MSAPIVEKLRRGCKNPTGARRPSPREIEAAQVIEELLEALEELLEVLPDTGCDDAIVKAAAAIAKAQGQS